MTTDRQDFGRAASTALGVVNLGLGTTIIAGGPARFPPPTYNALLNVWCGEVWPYGMMFLMVGLALILPSRRVNLLANWGGVVAMNVFAGLFFVSMVKDPNAAATAWWTYFSVGGLHGAVIGLMLTEGRRGVLGPRGAVRSSGD